MHICAHVRTPHTCNVYYSSKKVFQESGYVILKLSLLYKISNKYGGNKIISRSPKHSHIHRFQISPVNGAPANKKEGKSNINMIITTPGKSNLLISKRLNEQDPT